jgi:hypothetical protein
MHFLANENIPGDAVEALRAPATMSPGSGATRPVVPIPLSWPARCAESRILLTFDKDFGELAWREGLPATCGVILFRLPHAAACDGRPSHRRNRIEP